MNYLSSLLYVTFAIYEINPVLIVLMAYFNKLVILHLIGERPYLVGQRKIFSEVYYVNKTLFIFYFFRI